MEHHQPDRIIDRHELQRLVPYSNNHLLRLERQGKFPKRLKLGPNRVGWLLGEILAWTDRLKANRRARAHHEAAAASQRYARRQH